MPTHTEDSQRRYTTVVRGVLPTHRRRLHTTMRPAFRRADCTNVRNEYRPSSYTAAGLRYKRRHRGRSCCAAEQKRGKVRAKDLSSQWRIPEPTAHFLRHKLTPPLE